MNETAALYLRLSKEDIDKLNEGDESASIQNQRLLLSEYAKRHGFTVITTYSDDDESGLYDSRPGFEKMIEDAKMGKFKVIIAKTQSRFSRNMEHIEKYLHHDLPMIGVRFIGVVDNTDTNDKGGKKARQVNGLVNEWYCEDLSANIRSVFAAKQIKGQFLGSSCPYGYQKDPQDHNHLVIDDYAASVVRRIFALYLQGYGKAKIGSILSNDGILIPTLYKQQILGINYKNSKLLDETRAWSYQTIHTILNNQVYIGDMVQNKCQKISYKDKKKKAMPRDQWIIKKGTHAPIIDADTFYTAQRMQKTRRRSVSAYENGIFSGMLFCAECKKAMGRNYARRGEKGFIGYICKTYKTAGKKFCSSHAIRADMLEKAVLQSIRSEAQKILRESDIDELKKFKIKNGQEIDFQHQIDVLTQKSEKIEKYKKGAFENQQDGLISMNDYIAYVNDYNAKQKDIQMEIQALQQQKEKAESLDTQHDEWEDAFKNYIDIDKLDRNIVVELIDHIDVRENGVIEIYYKFKNPYEQ